MPKAHASATSFDSSIQVMPQLLLRCGQLSVCGHHCATANIPAKAKMRDE
jgi:hypothetical protein